MARSYLPPRRSRRAVLYRSPPDMAGLTVEGAVVSAGPGGGTEPDWGAAFTRSLISLRACCMRVRVAAWSAMALRSSRTSPDVSLSRELMAADCDAFVLRSVSRVFSRLEVMAATPVLARVDASRA